MLLFFGVLVIVVSLIWSLLSYQNSQEFMQDLPIELYIPTVRNSEPFVMVNLRVEEPFRSSIAFWQSILIVALGIFIGLPYLVFARILFYFSNNEYDVQNIYRLLRRIAITVTNQK